MEKFLVVVFDIAKYPKFFLVELGYGFLSKFYAYYVFQILNLTSEKGSILLNRQLSAKGKPACTGGQAMADNCLYISRSTIFENMKNLKYRFFLKLSSTSNSGFK